MEQAGFTGGTIGKQLEYTREENLRLRNRVEELEQAIRSFTSEESDDLTEALFNSMNNHNQSVWKEDLDKHREAINSLRALVIPHRPITADPKSPG